MVRAGLRGYFETVVGGGDVTKQKPDPEPYLLGAEPPRREPRRGPRRLAAGMAAGRAAGFDVLQVRIPNDLPRRPARRRISSFPFTFPTPLSRGCRRLRLLG